ncbi:tRNA (N(6)-L-threonylcarbamoyladenosine(37)-C(2))-methylthiotransferase MtaB [Rhodoferax sp. 4810]|uniref:tRNA (N(6)-L-threonylcarbamoyladenosine(37)-C(2))-methylthiotransferase MtaB n=1 Tax=Thiospirillum jenense TaxID=1653858 RepID=A0A839HEG0_9GAMM|nr:tRNA (N(6)-L-threonylcarbamoyladenosine(37)-C(2))-methylthiotransferase MtaB [Thiospirillum jenense]MBB1074536.1 tRNA (N(6)-L-threonylcarbamoyladenosine(37)-C(2))-methylthiotransferase MtaB [Rhodoferax jenense]MBB1126510.1 tRNA (N(6)-L-threonylcarbamoyladenosine(37)-C(2))-methylthiotransferase MtaB [Thiospirillum jenense]
MQVQLATLGCRLNEAETEYWARQLNQAGATILNPSDVHSPADLIIINTCAVTADAVRKSRRLIHRLRNQYPHARCVVTGCAASLPVYHAGFQAECDILIPNADKDQLVSLINAALQLSLSPMNDQPASSNVLFTRGRQRAFIKIQDGCRHRCHFCMTTLARGAERSRPIAEIIQHIQQLTTEDIHEVLLTGVHVAGYGHDLHTNLMALLTAILNDTSIERIRLGALEPWELPTALWSLFDNPRLMPHLHLPVQSGSDQVLKRMGRRGSAIRFAELVSIVRERIPTVNLTTDIIVGFPGETDADWQQTLALVTQSQFSHVHSFAYSPRPGTRAADLPQRIDAAIMQHRIRELKQLTAVLKRTQLERQLGRADQVLIEARPPDCREWVGYTRNYFPVKIAIEAAPSLLLTNQIIPVRLTTLTPDGLALHGQCITELTRGL